LSISAAVTYRPSWASAWDFCDVAHRRSFDAVFAMNCLLHVPNHDLPAVRAVLRPGGLFFVGVYGGNESAEGPIDDDEHVPPRFFSWRTDEQLLGFAASARFDVVDFHPVDTGRGYRFQSLTLCRHDPE
jgi:SAM-dependent methyltransferase